MKRNPCVRILTPDHSVELSDRQVSLAWAWLANPKQDQPPRGLRHLQQEDWVLLSDLLDDEMQAKKRLPVH